MISRSNPHGDSSHGLMGAEPDVDQWGVPYSIFGPHPEEFWGGIGRVASLSALLEDRLLTLLNTLRATPADDSPALPMHQLLAELKDECGACKGIDEWSDFGAYLARAEKCTDLRNDLIHSIWPVQRDRDVLFGHRAKSIPRKLREPDGPAAERKMVTTSLDEIRSVVTDLVALTDRDFRRWFSLANSPVPSIKRGTQDG